MRVRHLSDIEIQALLDRRAIGQPVDISGELYRKDLDSQEHLDNCPVCRAETELYRGLYADLGRSEAPRLSRSFARRVTFSLPPFKAQRTRARLQLAAVWGASLLISLFWLVGQIPFGVVVARSMTMAIDLRQQTDTALSLLASILPVSALIVKWILVPLAGIASAVQKAFTTEVGPANTFVAVGLVLLMIVWVDRLFLTSLRQER